MPGTYISPAESELYYLQSRYYDPQLRRFLSADNLVAETITDKEVRHELVEQFMDEAGLTKHRIREILTDYFADTDERENEFRAAQRKIDSGKIVKMRDFLKKYRLVTSEFPPFVR